METDIDVLGPTRNSVNGLAGGCYSDLVVAIEIVCRHSMFSVVRQNSKNYFTKPYITSYEAFAKPTYSASCVEVVTKDCCFDFQEMGPPFRGNMNPEVDRLLFTSAAKSESLYP